MSPTVSGTSTVGGMPWDGAVDAIKSGLKAVTDNDFVKKSVAAVSNMVSPGSGDQVTKALSQANDVAKLVPGADPAKPSTPSAPASTPAPAPTPAAAPPPRSDPWNDYSDARTAMIVKAYDELLPASKIRNDENARRAFYTGGLSEAQIRAQLSAAAAKTATAAAPKPAPGSTAVVKPDGSVVFTPPAKAPSSEAEASEPEAKAKPHGAGAEIPKRPREPYQQVVIIPAG